MTDHSPDEHDMHAEIGGKQSSPDSLLDLDRIERTLGSSEPALIEEFLGTYQQYAAEEMSKLAGLRADLERQPMRELAHRLKSSSYSMGALRLAETLSALEALCLQPDLSDEVVGAALDEVEQAWQLTRARIAEELNGNTMEPPLA